MPTVEEIAGWVRRLDRQQQARLLRLVPELETVKTEKTSETAAPLESDVEAALSYFREAMASFSDARPMQDDDPFIGGLTVGEFFALPEAEQEHLWNEAHLQAEKELGQREFPVRPDAMPPR